MSYVFIACGLRTSLLVPCIFEYLLLQLWEASALFDSTVLRTLNRLGIVSVLLASFLLAACNTPSTTQHKALEPLFDIYTTGVQKSIWSVDANTTNGMTIPNLKCTSHVVGHGSDIVTFTTSRRVTVRATTVNGDVILTSRFGGPSSLPSEMFGGTDLQGTRDTTGTTVTETDISPPGTCQPVAGGAGGAPPPPLKYACGAYSFRGPVALLFNKREVSIQASSLTPMIPAGYVPCQTAEYQIIQGIPPAPPIEGIAPANKLVDDHTLSFQVTAHGSQAAGEGRNGYSGLTTLDWTMTFCRVSSTLAFQQATAAAMVELQKSGFFAKQLEPYLKNKQVIVEELPVTAGDTNGGSLGRPIAAAGNRGPFKAEIRWDNITDVYLLASVLAHELGHADLNIKSGGFDLNEAAPFLTFDQFRTLGFEGEYEADMAALHVLQDLRAKAAPADQPCIQTQIDNDDVMKEMDNGNDALARQMIEAYHGPGYQQNYSGAHNVSSQTSQDLQDIQPLVTQFLQSTLWQQIQAGW